jgi:hypothetical protein
MGMELFLLREFQRQVLLQCQFVIKAEEQIEHALMKRDNIIVFLGYKTSSLLPRISPKLYGGFAGSMLKQDNLSGKVSE